MNKYPYSTRLPDQCNSDGKSTSFSCSLSPLRIGQQPKLCNCRKINSARRDFRDFSNEAISTRVGACNNIYVPSKKCKIHELFVGPRGKKIIK